MSSRRNTLAVCNIYYPLYHGLTDDSSSEILGQFMVEETYNFNEIMRREHISLLNIIRSIGALDMVETYIVPHPIIRNYVKIIRNNIYPSLEIIESTQLLGGEEVACIKTHWLRLIQRTYKRIFRERCKCIALRSNPSAMRYREVHGRWPSELEYMPTLRGCLVGI